ncbi:PilZ domain-containing protein [Sphingomonadaceae bacterium]|nr:PilZ domain-containing protein [Sphingomonadaceae bacterium]
MRSYNRLQTNQTIECEIDGARETVQIYNLSCGGCMIETGACNAQEGESLEVFLGPQISMPGKVAWRVGSNAGVQFLLPLHQAVVEAFGFSADDEDFDREDRRDRFGLPLIGVNHSGAGRIE